MSEQEKTIGWGKGVIWEQLFLPLYTKQQKGAILLNLCNAAPLLLKNQIVTIHDLAFEEENKWFKAGFKNWYRFLIPRICVKSRLIFTVSGFSKKQIIEHYKIPENKIKIIPNGLPEITFNNTSLVDGNYVLITGANNPRKNANWIINNITILKENNIKLVVLGDSATIYQEVKKKNDAGVVFLKNVPTEEYYALLKHAKALLFPSLYEGFGIPILESLCIGTPVIAADLDVYKESFATLPVYFKINDINDFRLAIKALETKKISDLDIEKLKNKFNFDNSVVLLIKSLEQLYK